MTAYVLLVMSQICHCIWSFWVRHFFWQPWNPRVPEVDDRLSLEDPSLTVFLSQIVISAHAYRDTDIAAQMRLHVHSGILVLTWPDEKAQTWLPCPWAYTSTHLEFSDGRAVSSSWVSLHIIQKGPEILALATHSSLQPALTFLPLLSFWCQVLMIWEFLPSVPSAFSESSIKELTSVNPSRMLTVRTLNL